MFGVSPQICAYYESLSQEIDVQADTHNPTVAEDLAQSCGHFVTFTARNKDVSFNVFTSGAIEKAFSAFLFLALCFLNF